MRTITENKFQIPKPELSESQTGSNSEGIREQASTEAPRFNFQSRALRVLELGYWNFFRARSAYAQGRLWTLGFGAYHSFRFLDGDFSAVSE